MRDEPRDLPDEFLGALFGAWIGIATEVWNRPWVEIIVFIVGIASIAFLLNLVAVLYTPAIRWGLIILLLSISITSGVVFSSWRNFQILEPNQLTFFYFLLIAWVLVKIVSPRIHARLSELSARFES